MLKGWNYERFSKSEVEDATGGTWAISFTVDSLGFEVMVIRWQLSWNRKLTSEQILERAKEVTL